MRKILSFKSEGNPTDLYQFNPRYGALVTIKEVCINKELFGDRHDPKNIMKSFEIRLVEFDKNSELGYVVLGDETDVSTAYDIIPNELSDRLRRIDTLVNTRRAAEAINHLSEFDAFNDFEFFINGNKYVCYQPPYIQSKRKEVEKKEYSSHSSAKDAKKK